MTLTLFLLFQSTLPLLLKFYLPRQRLHLQFLAFFQDLFLISLFLLFPIKWGILFCWLNHLYLAADFFLYQEMRLRLELRYILYIRSARYWIESAKRMNLQGLIWGSLLLTLINSALFSLVKSYSFPPLASLGFSSLAFLSLYLIPEGAQYLLNHPLFLFRKRFLNPISIPVASTFPEGPKQFDLIIAPQDKPHVVFLFMESFGAKHIGPWRTPNFHRLISQGIYFSNFYSQGTFTYRALLAALFGTPAGSTASGLAPYVGARLKGIPEWMKGRGYKTAFHHNGSLRYDMQEPFLKYHFDELADQNGIGGTPSSSWGVDDESLMSYSANWLEKQTDPSFLTLFTISNHHPWIVPKGYEAPLGHRFLQTLHYSDYALGRFITMLKEKNLSQRTLLFIVGDHGQPMGEHDRNFYNSRFLYEENVRVPLLILGEGRIQTPRVISDLGSHLDLFPTIVDLFGEKKKCLGVSLLRQMRQRPIFLQNPYSEGFVGFREGKWKWIENQRRAEEELYNLEEDPNEENNLISQMPVLAAQLKDRGRSFVAQVDQIHLSLSQGKAPETVLNFSDSLITDKKLEEVGGSQSIRIHLENCLLLTDRGIIALFARAPQLEEVNLNGISDLTSEIFKKGFPELSVLYLSEPMECKERVRLGEKLKVFSLHGKNIADFEVENLIYLTIYDANAVSEEVLLSFLKKNPNLVRLTIYGSEKVTHQTLEYLRTCPLEQLSLHGA